MHLLLALLLNIPTAGSSTSRVTHDDGKRIADSLMSVGDEFLAHGNLEQAAMLYEQSSRMAEHRDNVRLRKLAEVNVWMRKFAAAELLYGQALSADHDDDASRSALDDLRRSRSVHLGASLGGSEIDYARNVSGVNAFVGSVDWLDLYGAYTESDRIHYQRTSLSTDAYLFPVYDMYFRIGGRYRIYSYPSIPGSSPDITAYDRVPDLQVEWGYSFTPGGNLSVEAEYFVPNFFHARDLKAHNLKLGLQGTHYFGGPVFVKAFAALLRDPDPASFIAEPSNSAIQSFTYELLGLIGGGAGYDDERLNVEVQYVPDRDLDRSLAWSVFAHVAYAWSKVRLRYDILYDRYATVPTIGTAHSQVNMITAEVYPFQDLALCPGVKILTRDITEVMPFISVRYRTGL